MRAALSSSPTLCSMGRVALGAVPCTRPVFGDALLTAVGNQEGCSKRQHHVNTKNNVPPNAFAKGYAVHLHPLSLGIVLLSNSRVSGTLLARRLVSTTAKLVPRHPRKPVLGCSRIKVFRLPGSLQRALRSRKHIVRRIAISIYPMWLTCNSAPG